MSNKHCGVVVKVRCAAVSQQDLEKLKESVMAKLSELAGLLAGLTAQVNKSKVEITEKIQSLEDAINDAAGDKDLTPEVADALEALKSAVQSVDDINPDAPVAGPSEPA